MSCAISPNLWFKAFSLVLPFASSPKSPSSTAPLATSGKVGRIVQRFAEAAKRSRVGRMRERDGRRGRLEEVDGWWNGTGNGELVRVQFLFDLVIQSFIMEGLIIIAWVLLKIQEERWKLFANIVVKNHKDNLTGSLGCKVEDLVRLAEPKLVSRLHSSLWQ